MNPINLQSVTIEQLAAAIAEHVRPAVPISVALWDADTVGIYLQKTGRQVRERYALMRGFPKAIRLPSGGKEKGHPRWKAEEVIEWAEGFQEKRRT